MIYCTVQKSSNRLCTGAWGFCKISHLRKHLFCVSKSSNINNHSRPLVVGRGVLDNNIKIMLAQRAFAKTPGTHAFVRETEYWRLSLVLNLVSSPTNNPNHTTLTLSTFLTELLNRMYCKCLRLAFNDCCHGRMYFFSTECNSTHDNLCTVLLTYQTIGNQSVILQNLLLTSVYSLKVTGSILLSTLTVHKSSTTISRCITSYPVDDQTRYLMS